MGKQLAFNENRYIMAHYRQTVAKETLRAWCSPRQQERNAAAAAASWARDHRLPRAAAAAAAASASSNSSTPPPATPLSLTRCPWDTPLHPPALSRRRPRRHPSISVSSGLVSRRRCATSASRTSPGRCSGNFPP
jgi:hypothetical protein